MTREEYFCNNYLDKLYYYFLKKTGNVYEASDLSGEVSLEVLKALKIGFSPEHFNGWVWAIAKNKYAGWAKKKHIKMENESDEEIENIQVASETLTEDIIIYDEQINELRRELSLIEREYREIIVAYYVENKSIAEISKKLSIPQGTVKTKLFKIRKRLKEGTSMARTFGKLSYAPEEIEFHQSGGKSTEWEPDIYIWDDLHSKICKNILIEAYRNPVTMQELSIELGIAMPYLEPFVDGMTNATLLIKHGSKDESATYETNFVIISSESWRKMIDKCSSIQKEFVVTAREYLEKSRELQLQSGNYILGKYQDYEEQKWTLSLRLADDIQWSVYDKRNLGFNYDTVRPNGGSWDIMGTQKYDGPEFLWIGHSRGWAEGYRDLEMFVTEATSEKVDEFTASETIRLINSIIDEKTHMLSEREIQKLLDLGLIERNEDGLYNLTFGIYSSEHNSEALRYGVPIEIYNEELLPLWNRLLNLGEEYICFCEDIMKKEIPARLMNQFNFCMHSIPFLRGMVAEGLVEDGFMKADTDLSPLAGVYMCV